MLFQRLYNWIKYKTLPSSFLFKNRLFIERDSKHRRIFSNFGLNFRSSKWSMYDTYNIKAKSKTSFLKYFCAVLVLILLFFFVLNYSKFYITLNFFNNVAFFVWIVADSFDYYFSFILWIITSLLSAFFNTIYSYFFFNNFSKKKDFQSFSLNFKNSFAKNLNSLSSSKEDLNWIFYSWITNTNPSRSPKLIESIFETNVNKNWWLRFYDFFPTLYNSLFTINQISNATNRFDQRYLNIKTSHVFKLISDNKNFSPYYDVIFYHYLKKNTTNLSASSVINNFSNEWSIRNNTLNNLEYSFLVKNKNGLFFLDNLNYAKFNYLFSNFNEFWSLNFFIKNQIDSAKWNRWLYRYSTLHRKILKTSHKLTLSKKLISSGFYDNNLFNKNIWAAENISKFSNNSAIFNLTNLSYQNPVAGSDSFYSKFNYSGLSDSRNNTKISLTSFYENSYFWFLKRNYLLNNLPSNLINSGLKKNTKTLSYFLDFKNSNDLELLNYYSSTYYFLASNINSLSFWNKKSHHTVNARVFDNTLTYNPSLRDIQILLNDSDSFSKDNLLLLSWLTSTTTLDYSNLYLKYLSTKNSEYANTLSTVFYSNSNLSFSDLRYYFFLTSLGTDTVYLKDVLYANLFN